MRTHLLLTFSLAAALAVIPQPARAAAPAGSQPNIIFILADDYGIPGVGCYGGTGQTPNLDKLAATGLRFERCYAAPLCAPTRAMCMTGRFGFRTGVTDNPHGGKAHPSSELSIAKLLKGAGYATAVAGKWRQLAYFSTKADGAAWGFDEFLIWGLEQAAGDGRYWDPVYNDNGKRLEGAQGQYGPDLVHNFVVDFIRRHKEEPFFIYYPSPLIHGPILRTPDTKPGVTAREQLYADNIAYLDKLMGKLAAALDDLNLRERTLIVFVGDNGSVGEREVKGRVVDGSKGTVLEGGSRVPLIVNWKGTTPAGRVLSDLVECTDFFATFAEVAGVKIPAGLTLDSHSFAPQLRGEKGSPREWVFIQLDRKWYARNDGWKLNESGQLFDMSDAPYAEKPVATGAETPAVKAARQQLQAVLDRLNPAAGKLPDRPPRAEKKATKKAGKKQK